jgi:Protein of unknown function (DUF3352)
MPSRMRPRQSPSRIVPTAPALAALAATLAGALAGCGGSSTGTSADPASVAPASAPVYVGAVVRPGGSLQSDALAAARKLTGRREPYGRLLGVLQTPGSPTLDYSRDVAPWLGPNAGLFLTSLGSSEALAGLLQQGLTGGGSGGAEWPFGPGGAGASAGAGAQGAIVLDTSDLAKARSFVASAASHASAYPSSYRGVAYELTSGGDAFAVVDRFVVLGTAAGVRAVIDTTKGGASLQSDSTYANLQSLAPSGVLAHVYANPAALSPSGGPGAGTGATGGARASSQSPPALLQALGGERPLNVSLVPSASSIALDADVGGAPTGTAGGQGGSGGLVAAAAAGNRALGELPGESWLAAGVGNVGGAAGGGLRGIHALLSLVSTLGSAVAGEGVTAPSSQTTFSVGALLKGLLAPLNALSANGAQARREFLGWMGDAGVFASGTTVLELKGGVVIDSTDPSASRTAVARLGAALRGTGAEVSATQLAGTEAAIEAKITGLPLPLVIADGRSAAGQVKFVLGLGASSVQNALHPPSTMASSSAYAAADSALGEGIAPSIAVDLPTLLSLLEGVGLSEDPLVSPFLPYLRSAGALAGGGKSLGGGAERLRLVLSLQPSSG